jgi:hypothetical protein
LFDNNMQDVCSANHKGSAKNMTLQLYVLRVT